MKILLVANTDWYLYNFRLGLAEALRARGDEVVLASPEGAYAARLSERGFKWIRFDMTRGGVNPFVEASSILQLTKLYRREKPDLVHHFTLKCVLYGSLAAQLTQVQAIVNSIEGLGYAFTERENRRAWLRQIIKLLCRLLLRGTRLVFLNTDDMEFFLNNHLAIPAQVSLAQGAGVDLRKFAPQPFPEGIPLVVLAARMLWDKGLREFREAANILKEAGVKARFALVGSCDEENPASASPDQLKELEKEAVIEWWGWKDKMESVYAQAAIVCLPSYYREGVPKSLLEAAACGRPIVASNIPGCRELVRQGENGLLVPARDVAALAEALRKLLEDPDLRTRMGSRSREIAEADYSSEAVNAEMFRIYAITKKIKQ